MPLMKQNTLKNTFYLLGAKSANKPDVWTHPVFLFTKLIDKNERIKSKRIN